MFLQIKINSDFVEDPDKLFNILLISVTCGAEGGCMVVEVVLFQVLFQHPIVLYTPVNFCAHH